MIKKLTALELKAKIQQGEQFLLLDVREPNEFNFVNIQGSLLIPTRSIPQRIGELNRDQDIVVLCHHGMRSQQVAEYLVTNGFSKVFNLVGGIDAWAIECDSTMPRY